MGQEHDRRTRDPDQRWLQGSIRLPSTGGPAIRAVDLFCGCGGMTLGLEESARRLGLTMDVRLAIDTEPRACRVYRANFPASPTIATDVWSFLDGNPGDELSVSEVNLRDYVGRVDVLLGGPPCEGHSDLNNHTRRKDPKNALYLRMARAAEVLRARTVVIENVPPVLWDSQNVVEETRAALEKLGYRVHGQVVDLLALGIPQTRRRYILLASAEESVDPIEVIGRVASESRPRDVRWSIGDLEGTRSLAHIDKPSQMSEDNRRRVDYLFKNDLFDLPNTERPKCHRDEEHSYKSMYGRLRWDQPAQTVTTGFTSMGQGRFVHPGERRTLTPHEAARLQTFPDWFDWNRAGGRTSLAMMIGNAVPPLMMVRLGSLLLPTLVTSNNPSGGTRRASKRGRPASSSEEASKRMRAVRQRGTKPELRLEQELQALGLDFLVDTEPVVGTRCRGDFLFRRAKLVVLVDGCFWHSCPDHATIPKSNEAWWREKLAANKRRDTETNRVLRAAGFTVIRVWSHEDMTRAAVRIKAAIDRRHMRDRSPKTPMRAG